MIRNHTKALIIAGMSAIMAHTAGAAVIDITINGVNNAQGNPLNATAQVTTTTDTITIVLSNLTVDMKAADQAISAFSFVTGIAPTGSSSLTSIIGAVRTVNNNKSYSDGADAADNLWSLTTNGSNLSISAPLPKYTMVGLPNASDLYSNANASVTNNAHNPHLAPTVTFILNVPGIADDTLISNATMQFGTAPGENVFNPSTVTEVPEPASMALFGLGALLIAKSRRAGHKVA